MKNELATAVADVTTQGVPTRVVVVCSVTGGTGSGFLVPTLDYLLDTLKVPEVSVVAFGRYFSDNLKPNEIAIHDSNARVMISDLKKRYLAGGQFRLRWLTLLTGNVQRSVVGDPAAKNLPAPGAQNPFAEARAAVVECFSNAIAAAPTGARSVALQNNVIADATGKAASATKRAVEGLGILLQESPDLFRQSKSDPLSGLIWGRRAMKTLVEFGAQRARESASETGPALGGIYDALLHVGRGAASGYGFLDLLPAVPDGRPSPSAYARLQARIPDWVPGPVEGHTDEQAARHLLYWLSQGAAS